jgi:hypothetical protein
MDTFVEKQPIIDAKIDKNSEVIADNQNLLVGWGYPKAQLGLIEKP